jgi:hypothetical protein
MPQSIPLRTALRVHLDYIIVRDDVVITMTLTLVLEIDNSLLEAFTTSDAVVEVVEAQVELNGFADSDFT